MSLKITHTRWLAALMAGAIALGTFAPVAEAGRGNDRGHKSKRYKDKGSYCETRVVRHSYRPRYKVRERSHGRHGHGSEIASFVGGLIVGVAVSHAASANDRNYTPRDDYRDDYDRSYAPPPPRDYYYDPYCQTRYSSFDACGAHVSRCSHPQVVQVIEIRTGRAVDQYHYDDGRWRDRDGDYWAGNRR